MQVNLYATFRLIAGQKSCMLDLPAGATVRQAVDALLEQLPVLRSHWLDEQGVLYPHVHILCNRKDVETLPEKLDTILEENAVLDIIPPVAGG